MYWPVSTEAREGQHNGVVAYALEMVTPSSRNHLRTAGRLCSVSTRWSSVTIRRMFGLPSDLLIRRTVPPIAASRATAVTRDRVRGGRTGRAYVSTDRVSTA